MVLFHKILILSIMDFNISWAGIQILSERDTDYSYSNQGKRK